MSNVIQSSVSNPVEVIEQFIKSLDVFIKESILNIKEMKDKHQQMHNFWKGKQYDEFSIILENSIKDAARELSELQKLREQLVKKADLLRQAMNN